MTTSGGVLGATVPLGEDISANSSALEGLTGGVGGSLLVIALVIEAVSPHAICSMRAGHANDGPGAGGIGGLRCDGG